MRTFAMCLFAYFLAVCNLTLTVAAEVNPPTQVPAEILRRQWRNTWLLNDGTFVVENRGPRQLQIMNYDSSGAVKWKYPIESTLQRNSFFEFLSSMFFGRNSEPPHIIDVVENVDQIFVLIFESELINNQYEKGKYQLYRCDKAGGCKNVKTFSQGVFQLAVDATSLLAVEYDFAEIHHPIESPPIVAHRATLNRYSLNAMDLVDSTPYFALLAIDRDQEDSLFGELLSGNSPDANSGGIYQITGQKLQRVGSYQPGKKIFADDHQPLQPVCTWFLYDLPSAETVCIDPTGGSFLIRLIRTNGSFTKESNSLIYPKRWQDGRILVADEGGKILEIHAFLGGNK